VVAGEAGGTAANLTAIACEGWRRSHQHAAVVAVVVWLVGVHEDVRVWCGCWCDRLVVGASRLVSRLPLEALRTMSPRVFGVLMSLERAGAALVGLLVLHEALQPLQ
jgi:inner membrane transporter RhtA